MKRVLMSFVLIVFAVSMMMASVARAQEADAPKQNVGYEKGFYIKNDDNTFRLTLGGRLQTKFYYNKDPKSDPQSQITFTTRRAQLDVTANIHEALTMGFTLKHAVLKAGGGPFATVQVAGATMAYEVIPAFIVEVGMVGLPLDMMTDTSSKWLLLNEFPVTATQDEDASQNNIARPSFGAPDGLGIKFSGELSKWFYQLSLVNGYESNYTINPDKKVSVGFRTGVNILDPVPGSMTDFANSAKPKLTVSIGTDYLGKRNDPGTGANIKYLWTSSAGAAFRWKGFAATAEAYYRKTKMQSPGTGLYNRLSVTDAGYYGALGYYVIPKKLELAAQGGQIFRQGPSNDSYEIGGGINYYIFNNNLKLQFVYDMLVVYAQTTQAGYIQQTSVRQKNHNFSVMASAFF